MEITAFTDGASSGNPGPGGWGVVLLISDDTVQELGGGESPTTNNRMELRAALEAIRWAGALDSGLARMEIHTDSSYLMNGIQKWIHGWKKRGWKTAEGKDVLNRDLWEDLDAAVRKLTSKSRLVWKKVKGHSGDPGNDRADAIAVAYSKGVRVDLYGGPADSYVGMSRAANGPWYVSLVDGSVERHGTWAECEARVKGAKGARFKKVKSEEEEGAVLQSWGWSR